MAKFKVGDVVVCVDVDGMQGRGIKFGDEFIVEFCGNGSMYTEQVGITAPVAQWCSSRFELVGPKPTLQEIYNIEADKLHEQAAKVDAAWRLIQAESVSLQASRQKAIQDKRADVGKIGYEIEQAHHAYHKATIELNEMLRNEPF